ARGVVGRAGPEPGHTYHLGPQADTARRHHGGRPGGHAPVRAGAAGAVRRDVRHLARRGVPGARVPLRQPGAQGGARPDRPERHRHVGVHRV
ncbi:MAG: hypothetical protein AVDCRST_MAG60-1016, partial [uncultured Nocardioides sp.]